MVDRAHNDQHHAVDTDEQRDQAANVEGPGGVRLVALSLLRGVLLFSLIDGSSTRSTMFKMMTRTSETPASFVGC